MAGSEALIGRELRRLFDGGAVAGLTEAQLLDCVARRDESAGAAFEAILIRHGPAVLACCRRVLGDSAAAEDAFQATFLVLFRRAGSTRVEGTLEPWLRHVARLSALKAREAELRRRTRERRAARPEAIVPVEDASERHLLVRDEVDRLPGKYREPVRLCYFEGRTHDDAAAALGWPVGTVRGRLSRARDLLRTRLVRRGVGLSPTALVAALATGGDARAEVPRALVEATLAAVTGGASVRVGAVALAAAVARGLSTATAIKVGAVAATIVAMISAGVGIAAMAGRGEEPQPQPAVAGKVAGVDRYGDPLPKGAIARLGTERFRHHAADNFVRQRALLAPDGRTVVTVGADGAARIWELATGRLVGTIEAKNAAISHDGGTLFAAGPGFVRVLDFPTGRERRRFEVDTNQRAPAVVASPDGKSLALGTSWWQNGGGGRRAGYRSALFVHDATTLERRWRIEKDRGFAQDIAFSPDGRRVAMAGPDEEGNGLTDEPGSGSVRLYDVNDGAEVRGIVIKGSGVATLAFAPDGKTVAAGVGDGTIRLYDPATGAERLPRLGSEWAVPRPAPGHTRAVHSIDYLAFSPDGSRLASGVEATGWSGRAVPPLPITLWDVATAREIRRFAGHPQGMGSLAFTPDGKTLVSTGHEPPARLWDVATGQEVDPRPGHSTNICGLVASPVDGTVFTFGYSDGPIFHWDPTDGQMLGEMGFYPNVINHMAISPDGRSLLLVDQGEGLVLWELAGRKEQRRFGRDDRLRFSHAAFSPDGRMIAGQFRVWDIATGRQLAAFAGGAGRCLSAFSADGGRVMTVESDRVATWNIATGAEVRRVLIPDLAKGGRVAISPDGRFVALGQIRSRPQLPGRGAPALDAPARRVDPIRVWEIASGRSVASLYGHTDASSALAFSPDGRTIASVGSGRGKPGDPGLRVWDAASGKPLRHFKNDPDGGELIAWLPDGRSIVTGGMGGIAIVWDVSDLANRRAEPPGAEALEGLWADLASDDGQRAHRASWALSADAAVPFLRDRLRPATAVDAARVAGSKGPITDSDTLRTLRAIAALERIDNAPARAILETLARGAPDAPMTRDAVETLLRLASP